MESKSTNKNKKRLLILVALVGVMGIGGVVAATSITINSGVPISLGAGYTTATTCDADVAITAGQTYVDNFYKINAFNITGLNVASGYCNNKIMQLAVVTSGGTQQASWSLPSSSDSFTFQFGASTSVSNAGSYKYASTAMTAFDIANLTTVALSIS
jgi:hypothetical protein